MISVQEVVVDPDMIAPQPYQILRSSGQFVLGGFQSTTTTINVFGPVQQATNREIQMLPEADRIGSIRSFWYTQPIYITRGYAPVPSTQGEAPQESSASTYTLSVAPPNGVILLYSNGLQLQPYIDYTVSGNVITFLFPPPTLPLYATWQVTANVATDASDILVYGGFQYRVLSTYRDDGSGYWKALAHRMAAA